MNVLYVGHDPAQTKLLLEELAARAPHLRLKPVPSRARALDSVAAGAGDEGHYDVVLTERRLPDGDVASLISGLREQDSPTPVVVLVDSGEPELPLQLFKAGVSDYVTKADGYCSRLPVVLERAWRRSRSEAADLTRSFRLLCGLNKESDGDDIRRRLSRSASAIEIHLVSAWGRLFAEAATSTAESDKEVRPYDALLIDFHFDGMNGIDIVKEMIEVRNCRIPVIFLVEPKDEEAALQAVRLGAAAYVIKDRGYLRRILRTLENFFHQSAADLRDMEAYAQDTYLQSLTENSEEFILILDPNGLFRYVSPAVERQLGYSPEEMIGVSWTKFISPDDHEKGIEDLSRAARYPGVAGPPVSLRVLRKNGQWVYAEGVAQASIDRHGKLRLLINARDITERRIAEERLIESERKLQTILAASQIGIGKVRNRALEWVNEFFCAKSGYTSEELVGQNTRFLYESNEEYERLGKLLYEEGEAEGRIVTKDGTVLDVYLKTSPMDSFSHIITVADITEQKRSESMLRLTQFSVDHSLDAVVWIGKAGELVYANDAACTTMGYTREELLSMTVFDVSLTATKERWENDWNRRKEQGLVFFEGVNRRKNGEAYPVEISSRYMAYGGREYTVGSIRDITERKRFEEALKEKAAFLEALLNASFDGILVVNLKGEVLFQNRRTVELWKIPPHIIEKNDRAAQVEHIRYMSGNPENFHERVSHADEHPDYVVRDEVELVNGTVLDRYSGPILGESGERYGRVWIFREITDTKKAEKALRKSEARFRALVEKSVEVIQLVNGLGVPEYVSPAITSVLGFSCDEYVSLPWDRLVHPEDMGGALAAVTQALANQGKDIGFSHRLRHKNGEWRWIEGSLRNLIYDPTVGAIVANFRDITDRKRAEEALRESEACYRALFDYSPVALQELDGSAMRERADALISSGATDLREYFEDHPDVLKDFLSLMRFSSINRAALDLYEAQDIEEFKAGFARFVENAPPDLLGDEVLAIAEGRSQAEKEQVRLTAKGSKRYILSKWTVAPGYEQTHGRVIVSELDLTQRREAEESLRRSEEKYRDIFERSVEGIFQSTPEGKFISVNPAYARMLGYDSPEELIEAVRSVPERIYLSPEEHLTYASRLETMDGASGIECEFVRKDGRPIWVSVRARAVRGADGRTLYYEGAAQDITERKHGEEERGKLQAQLRQAQKMEAIGTLAGGVAHDFNNILTVLSGYGTLLQMKIDATDPLRPYVDQILSATQKAASLTHSLLAFSRQQPIALSPVNVGNAVRGTEKLLKRLLTEDIALKTAVSDEELTVMADVTQIDQILFNLATNARDAMAKGGSLIIETKPVELDDDFVRVHGFGAPGKYVLLSVSDTGIGMDEATREKVFMPFFTTKEVGKGTGLGLSTVYGIVKQHKGYITLYSEPTVGTSFHIYLPASDGVIREQVLKTKPIKGGKETILIAEDNESVRLLLREMLARQGYRVIQTVDGQDAVDTFKTSKGVDILILDSVMPRKNGREAYEAIRQIDPHVKVIFTSGYTRDVVLDKGIEETKVEFISKPIQRNQLLEKVREVLDRK